MLKQSETREQALGEVTAVNFTGGVGDVRIRAAEPGESPKAVVTSSWGLWKPSTSVRTSEGTATLRSSCPSRSFGSVCGTDWLVVVPADSSLTLGACLNLGIDASDGAHVAKIDDDNFYGRHYLLDLVDALDYSGAGIAGKWAHYTVVREAFAELRQFLALD